MVRLFPEQVAVFTGIRTIFFPSGRRVKDGYRQTSQEVNAINGDGRETDGSGIKDGDG